jgi:hypothetical protein
MYILRARLSRRSIIANSVRPVVVRESINISMMSEALTA